MATLASGCSNNAGNKREAQQITCVNNLHVIAMAFKTWEGDNDDQFPFNVSTNASGTKELCAPDKDGFDRNAYLYLKIMGEQGYLTVPKLLICPQDRSKKAATNWESLQPENVTYLFCFGTNVVDANPHEILAVCPIDGNVLHTDGTVVEKRPSVNETGQHPMQVR
jgi:hypothetical protein